MSDVVAEKQSKAYIAAADLVRGWMAEYYRYLVDGDPSNGLHPKAKAALTLRIADLIEKAGNGRKKP